MRVYSGTDTVTGERVLPAGLQLVALHPEFVKKIGPYIVWSIDEPSADERRCAFETGMMMVVELDTSGWNPFSSINKAARDWAAKHAGQQWPNISEIVRQEIGKIITRAFGEKTPFSEVIDEIRIAGDFSEACATMIAETEISQAQVGSNFDLWKQGGLVKKVKWLADRDPCPLCKANDGQVRELGEPFPSGDVMPTAHPCCRYILNAVEFVEKSERKARRRS